MNRQLVLKIRLLPTVAALLLVAAVVCLVWYPAGYASISGVGKLLIILVGVNLVLGPGLSALVYKPGKPGLWLDLGLLAGAEVIALALAVSVMYERRPVYAVFAVDRFEAVADYEVDREQIAHASLLRLSAKGPRLIFARMPTDPEAHEQLIDDVLFNGKADIDRRPEFWAPYASGVRAVKKGARPLETLLEAGDPRAGKVRRWLARQPLAANDYLFVPLRGARQDAAMVLHADIGYPVGILNVDPW